jgi:hypothetical protein
MISMLCKWQRIEYNNPVKDFLREMDRRRDIL